MSCKQGQDLEKSFGESPLSMARRLSLLNLMLSSTRVVALLNEPMSHFVMAEVSPRGRHRDVAPDVPDCDETLGRQGRIIRLSYIISLCYSPTDFPPPSQLPRLWLIRCWPCFLLSLKMHWRAST